MTIAHPLITTCKVFTDTIHYLNKSKDNHFSIESLKREWAHSILTRLRVELKQFGSASTTSPLILVGNHISYLDIPLLMSQVPKATFVAKKELMRWPVFGPAASRIDTVFVKRERNSSRKSARESIKNALQKGTQIVVFPSGTTCTAEKSGWRKGVFEVAHETGVSVQPFRLKYQPLRTVAYIERDFFPQHLFQISKLEKIQATIEFHDPVVVKSPIDDCLRWQEWVRELNCGQL